jgi:glutathione S-transferase
MSDPDLQLVGFPPSTFCQTAALALAEKGVEFTLQVPDFADPAYLEMHPFKRVPVLLHGSVRLYEALAIALYVDGAFDGPLLQPSDRLARCKMFQWISSYLDYGVNSILKFSVMERFQKMIRHETPDEEIIKRNLPRMHRFCDILEHDLSVSEYVAGNELSVADLFLIPPMIYFANTPEGRAAVAERPGVERWLGCVRHRPTVVARCGQLDWVVD